MNIYHAAPVTWGGSGPSSFPYSPECVEEEFCEVRVGVLWRWSVGVKKFLSKALDTYLRM